MSEYVKTIYLYSLCFGVSAFLESFYVKKFSSPSFQI